MSHFAKVDENNIVTQVIVAEQDFINTGAVGDPRSWVQTSYNTSAGVHRNGGTPLRYNYAGIGYLYHPDADAFSPPQPYASWVLNTTTYLWDPPVPMPNDGKIYFWNEDAQAWQDIAAMDPAQIPS
jgi:hypothetical protein